MPYATIADFEDTYGIDEAIELSNLDDAQSQSINIARLESAIDQASGLIDTYLAARYITPISTPPTYLTFIALDIARYRLDRYQPRDDIRVRYEDAIKWLEQVAKGVVELGLPELPNQLPTSGVGGSSRGYSDQGINLSGYDFDY